MASTLYYGSEAFARTPPHGIANEAVFCSQHLHGKMLAKTELFFGLAKKDGGVISEQAFQHFIDTEITPRFPEGLTLFSGQGQFRASTSGAIVQEASKMVLLLYPFSKQNNQAIEHIRTAYKKSFQQVSVLRVDGLSCVSF